MSRAATKKENKDLLSQITKKSHLSIDLPDSDKDSFDDDDDEEGQRTNDRLFDKSTKMREKFSQIRNKIEVNVLDDEGDLSLEQIEDVVTERLATEENKYDKIINVG